MVTESNVYGSYIQCVRSHSGELLMPNAAPQPRLEAGAQRTLAGVGCRRWFGAALDAWLSSGCFRVRRASACQAVSSGRVGSAAHSNKEPSYTATLGTPNNVSTNASLLAA